MKTAGIRNDLTILYLLPWRCVFSPVRYAVTVNFCHGAITLLSRLENFVDQEKIGQEGAQVDGGV